MKTTNEKIAVMQAYIEGKKIKIISNLGKESEICIKKEIIAHQFNWQSNDYEIVEEHKQVPFDVSDYEPLIGQLFRNIFIEGIEVEVKGMLVGIVRNRISIGTVKYSVPHESHRLEWYNKEIKMWLPCMKTVNN